MAYNVRILPRQGLDIIFYSSLVTRSDFDEVWRTLAESKDFKWDFDEIAVFGPDADVANLNFESVNAEAQRFKQTHEAVNIERNRRVAIVVSSHVQALNGKMFLAYIATNPPPHIEFKLFNSSEAGIEWIEEGRPADHPARRIDRAEVDRTITELAGPRRGLLGPRRAKVG